MKDGSSLNYISFQNAISDVALQKHHFVSGHVLYLQSEDAFGSYVVSRGFCLSGFNKQYNGSNEHVALRKPFQFWNFPAILHPQWTFMTDLKWEILYDFFSLCFIGLISFGCRVQISAYIGFRILLMLKIPNSKLLKPWVVCKTMSLKPGLNAERYVRSE